MIVRHTPYNFPHFSKQLAILSPYNMQLQQVFLTVILLSTEVFSSPRKIENANVDNTSKNISHSESNNPLVIIVEEKNPNSGSLLLEFVYNGNTMKDSSALEKDKYAIGPKINETVDKNSNITKSGTTKTQKATKKQPNAKKTKTHLPFKNADKSENVVYPLIIEEESPLQQKWPKYFFDAFNPIQPFPELQMKKISKIQSKKAQTQTLIKSTNENKRKPQDVAGPLLNPLSMYEREFMQPIFD